MAPSGLRPEHYVQKTRYQVVKREMLENYLLFVEAHHRIPRSTVQAGPWYGGFAGSLLGGPKGLGSGEKGRHRPYLTLPYLTLPLLR